MAAILNRARQLSTSRTKFKFTRFSRIKSSNQQADTRHRTTVNKCKLPTILGLLKSKQNDRIMLVGEVFKSVAPLVFLAWRSYFNLDFGVKSVEGNAVSYYLVISWRK